MNERRRMVQDTKGNIYVPPFRCFRCGVEISNYAFTEAVLSRSYFAAQCSLCFQGYNFTYAGGQRMNYDLPWKHDFNEYLKAHDVINLIIEKIINA